jgi:hypothetical protein
MRKIMWFAALAFAAAPAGTWAQSQAGPTGAQDKPASSTQAAPAQPPQPQTESLAEAARKAREQKKESKPAKVFTNDDLPTAGGISTVGTTSGAAAGDQNASNAPAAGAPKGEKEWRARFADLHKRLDQDQTALDVAQREANVDATQFYGGDPQKAAQDQMSQQPLGQDYNKKKAEIEAKQKQVADDQQAISDAEDELRKSGGDPGWAR